MLNRYFPHPAVYAIGEMEKWYAAQSAKGWFLEKRGLLLDHFHRGVPAERQYRVELSAKPTEQDEWQFFQERAGYYREFGWYPVTSRGAVHIFAAPPEHNAPEFWEDPTRQVKVIRRLNLRALGWAVPGILVLALLASILLTLAIPGMSSFLPADHLGWMLLQHSALLCAVCVFLLLLAEYCLHDALRSRVLANYLAKGKDLPHEKGSLTPHRIVLGILAGLFVVLLVFTGIETIPSRRRPLSREAEGPYLLLNQLGQEGLRVSGDDGQKSSTISYHPSLFARSWDTVELLDAGNDRVSLQQETFVLRLPFLRQYAADLLRRTRCLLPVDRMESDALDAAWGNDMEWVVIRGNRVAYVRYLAFDGREHSEEVLALLADLL